MGGILIQLLLTLMNLALAYFMYQNGSYKTAMFSCFGAGFCFLGLVDAIKEYIN